MTTMSALGKILYRMAKNKLAAQGLEIKGDYTVIAHDSVNAGEVAFMIDCKNSFQLTDEVIAIEKDMLRQCFSNYLNEVVSE